ncbi:hypothetical protein ABW19_dt0204482 [Dactylella cylindrospora]|nr:hypothetical protein ABW19_dt0204482 [Dactylella cylindrospora]
MTATTTIAGPQHPNMMLELMAFREQNPKEVHPDEWPTCDLYDAYVQSKNSSRDDGLIDLLDVLEKGPFTVKGFIRKIPEELEEFAAFGSD